VRRANKSTRKRRTYLRMRTEAAPVQDGRPPKECVSSLPQFAARHLDRAAPISSSAGRDPGQSDLVRHAVPKSTPAVRGAVRGCVDEHAYNRCGEGSGTYGSRSNFTIATNLQGPLTTLK
jgi:hypothetical protein